MRSPQEIKDCVATLEALRERTPRRKSQIAQDAAIAFGRWVLEDSDGDRVSYGDVARITGAAAHATYCTTYCNKAHRIVDGKPVDHECHVLPPLAIAAEREGDMKKAVELIQKAKPLQAHRGVRS